jgi:branched-chain amino acid transport system permease protein
MLKLRRSPFGMILRATHANPRRVDALGYSVFGVRLTAYVASGVLTGVAGLLLANLTAFASPSYMSWPVSGELIVMVVIGGLGSVLGPIVGAIAYLLMEEGFKSLTQHWMLLMGPAVVAIAMVAKGGYGSSLAWLRRPPPSASSSALPAGGESKTDRRPPDALAKEASV